MEGLGVSDLSSVPCTEAGSSFMMLSASWGSDHGGSYWGPVSREYSFQASLGGGVLEDLLIFHSFVRVKFSCVAIFECCSARFFPIYWYCAFTLVLHSGECVVKDRMVLGGNMPSSGV